MRTIQSNKHWETEGEGGVDRVVDAVRCQAAPPPSLGGKDVPNSVLMSLIKAVRPSGGIGAPGLDVTEDPGAPYEYANKIYSHFQLECYLKRTHDGNRTVQRQTEQYMSSRSANIRCS